MISVVVPVYIKEQKHIPMTYKCIENALDNTKMDFELVVVETCSEYFKEYADVHIYEKTRTFPARSINRAFHCCYGDFVVLLTNDAMVGNGWLERLVECFEKREDCGLATLASNQFNHSKEDKIEEGIWFSVAMMKKRAEYFDERFKITWNDTDLIMRIYAEGKKMYRNFNCIVEHNNPGTTLYSDPGLTDDLLIGKSLFIEKHAQHFDTEIFKILTGGEVK